MSKRTTSAILSDKTKLPSCVTGWREALPNAIFDDQSQLLVAVPILNRFSEGWHYDFEVVTVRCDEDYFALVDTDGDSWGWSYDDIDFYVVLNK